jgi:hypothetical protein
MVVLRQDSGQAMTDDEPAAANMADLVRAHHLLTTEVLRRAVTLRRQAN